MAGEQLPGQPLPPEEDVVSDTLRLAAEHGVKLSDEERLAAMEAARDRVSPSVSKALHLSREARMALVQRLLEDAKTPDERERLRRLAQTLTVAGEWQMIRDRIDDAKIRFRRTYLLQLFDDSPEGLAPFERLRRRVTTEILDAIPLDAPPALRKDYVERLAQLLVDTLEEYELQAVTFSMVTEDEVDETIATIQQTLPPFALFAQARGVAVASLDAAQAPAQASDAPAAAAAEGDDADESAAPAPTTFATASAAITAYIARLPEADRAAHETRLAEIEQMADGDPKAAAATELAETLHTQTVAPRIAELEAAITALDASGEDTTEFQQALTEIQADTTDGVFAKLDALKEKMDGVNPWPKKKKALEAYVALLPTGTDKDGYTEQLANLEQQTGPGRLRNADTMLSELHGKTVTPRITAIEKKMTEMPDSDEKKALAAELAALKKAGEDGHFEDAIAKAQTLYEKIFPPVTADPMMKRLAEAAKKGGLAGSILALVILFAQLDLSFGGGQPLFFKPNALAGLGFTQNPDGSWNSPTEIPGQGPTPADLVAKQLKDAGLSDDEIAELRGVTVAQLAAPDYSGTHLTQAEDAEKLGKARQILATYAGKTSATLGEIPAATLAQKAFDFMAAKAQEAQQQETASS